MAKTITRAEIRTLARQRADMENSQFIKDAEWNQYINDSYAELFDLLVGTFADYYISSIDFSLTSSDNGTYPLPADFYKLRGLDYKLSNDEAYNVNKYNFNKRNQKNRAYIYNARGYAYREYRVIGDNLQIEPRTRGEGNYTLWYIPAPVNLVSDSQTIDGVANWHEYIVIDVAMKALIKEESDISALVLQKNNMKQRIESMAAERDAGEPETVTDINADTGGFFNNDYWFIR